MTNPLKDLFLKNGIKRGFLISVPQFVDVDKYKDIEDVHSGSNYIAYAGSLNEKKDGVLTLIKAYQEVSKNYRDLSLAIAGFGTEFELIKMKDLIKELRLESKVRFLGCVQAKDMPRFLKNAKLLISCRPQSLQSEYGFPTKIVEYLASGRPTITTLTGELCIFLQDNKNAFIIDDLNINSVASKIMQVLDNYDEALRVAKNGYKLVEEQFNPAKHTKHLLGH